MQKPSLCKPQGLSNAVAAANMPVQQLTSVVAEVRAGTIDQQAEESERTSLIGRLVRA